LRRRSTKKTSSPRPRTTGSKEKSVYSKNGAETTRTQKPGTQFGRKPPPNPIKTTQFREWGGNKGKTEKKKASIGQQIKANQTWGQNEPPSNCPGKKIKLCGGVPPTKEELTPY